MSSCHPRPAARLHAAGRRHLLGLGLALFARPALAAGPRPVVLHGSGTFSAELLRDHGAEVGALAGHPLAVVTNNSHQGVLAVLRGEAELAMISAPLAEEVTILRRTAPGLRLDALREMPVGVAETHVVVHPSNPLRRLDWPRLAEVLRGELRDWSALGGAPGPIRLVAAREGAGAITTMEREVLGPGERLRAPGAIRVQQALQIPIIVEQEPLALGIAPRRMARGRAVARVELPGPVLQRLALVSLGEPGPEAAAVIAACRAVAGRVLG